MKSRHWALALALIGSACIALFADRSPESNLTATRDRTISTTPNAVIPKTRVASDSDSKSKSPSMPASLIELIPREILAKSRNDRDQSNLFSIYAAHPQTPISNAASIPAAAAFPYKYLGRRTRGDGWEVFLEKNESILIATTSEMVDDNYKIISVSATAVTFEFVATHEQTILTIE